MKKKAKAGRDSDLYEEYPAELIRKGVRGKYAKRFREGTNLVLLTPGASDATPKLLPRQARGA